MKMYKNVNNERFESKPTDNFHIIAIFVRNISYTAL